MIDNALDMVVKPILDFLGKHSPFILGVIINIGLIIIVNKIIDAFASKLSNKLKEKNSSY